MNVFCWNKKLDLSVRRQSSVVGPILRNCRRQGRPNLYLVICRVCLFIHPNIQAVHRIRSVGSPSLPPKGSDSLGTPFTYIFTFSRKIVCFPRLFSHKKKLQKNLRRHCKLLEKSVDNLGSIYCLTWFRISILTLLGGKVCSSRKKVGDVGKVHLRTP